MRAGGSPTGMSLRQQLQQQRSILAETRQRYSEDHPDVKRIERNIQSLEARIAVGRVLRPHARVGFADGRAAADAVECHRYADRRRCRREAMELRTKLTDLEGAHDAPRRKWSANTRP